jgi:hypothetical protein
MILAPVLRHRLGTAIIGMIAVSSVVACSSAPSAQSRACTGRSNLETSLAQLRSFDYAKGTASALAGHLDSARQGLVGIEAAAALPQNSSLRQLGGLSRIRQLEAEMRTLAASVRSGGNPQLPSFENTVRQRTADMQQVVGAVNGC